jgi:hypothetical protein
VRNASTSGFINWIWPSFFARSNTPRTPVTRNPARSAALRPSLFQQNQICGQCQRRRDGLSLTRIEIRREQSRDLVLPECLRFDPTVLDSLLDLLERCWVR